MKKESSESLQFESIKDDLSVLLNYLWHDERNHYIAAPSRYHIYVRMRRLARAINYRLT